MACINPYAPPITPAIRSGGPKRNVWTFVVCSTIAVPPKSVAVCANTLTEIKAHAESRLHVKMKGFDISVAPLKTSFELNIELFFNCLSVYPRRDI